VDQAYWTLPEAEGAIKNPALRRAEPELEQESVSEEEEGP
jgi:hypothetical protein